MGQERTPAPSTPPESRLDRGMTRDATDILQTLLDTIPIIVWEVDAQGVFVLSEGRGLEKLGLAPGQAVGLNAFDTFAADPEALAPVRRALAGEELSATVPIGGSRWDARYVPIRDAEGNVIGVRGFSIDVTEREQTAAALFDRVAQIEEQKDAIREMGTPIIKVWHDVIAVPIIGRVDEERAARMMEGLLASVVEGQARHAILDLTGVETMDQKTAEQIGAMMTAVRLLGARGILTGMRPEVARSMVSIDVDLSQTKILRDLCEAIQFCMKNQETTRTGRPGRGRVDG